ncbi:MAG TPA: AMP-binding protein [Microthrixaceae bacterium]|nr:AMP-binding protein [Microthrixaceae bacterium]
MELDVASICEAITAAQPDADCLIFRDRKFSWAQVQDRTRRLANVLARAGVGRLSGNDQDRVALYLHNGNEYLEGMLGAWKAGAVPFNVNYRYVAEELRYILDDAGAKVWIVHEKFSPVLAQVIEQLDVRPTLVLTVADGSGAPPLPGSIAYEDALAGATPELPDSLVGSWSGDDIYLCYTGGTTGMPKGAMWRQADFLVAALGVRRRDGSEFGSIAEVVEAARGTVRALPAPPLMHGAAHWNALSCWIAGGAVIIQDVVDRFDPADILATIERHRATSLLLVGDPMARPLVDTIRHGAESETGWDTTSLRHILSGGAVLSPATKQELLELLPGVRIVDVLGSTESGRQGISNVGDGDDVSEGFVRSPLATVLSEDLTSVLAPGDGRVGWLAQAGRVPLGYLNDTEKSARTFPVVDGVRYAVPGDRARLESDGSVTLLGRDSVCINTGGEKVFAEEVETTLKLHPAVLDAVVCGRPSERFGQEVVAIIELRSGHDVSDADLLSTAGEHLARYKLPRAILRRDRIVRSPSGKADYRWASAEATGNP